MQNNKKKTILFITNYKLKKILELLPSRKKFLLKYFNCDNKKNLKNLKHYLKKRILNDHIIISFSNSYIFKKEELKKFKDIHKINFHPATQNIQVGILHILHAITVKKNLVEQCTHLLKSIMVIIDAIN